MREKLFLTPETESWVISALVKNADVGEGTYSFVLDAEENGYVVKLTCSEADYKALVYFSCTNPHFPVVVKHAANQVKDRASCLYHAVMMEKLITYPPEANVIANHLNGMNNKRNPLSLISAAENINKGKFNKYPISLRQALHNLGTYAHKEMQLVELNQLSNWGKRSDGSLVILDLVHSRNE